MAEATIAQLEPLFQDLATHLNAVNDLFSQAWVEVELARDAWKELQIGYKVLQQEREHLSGV
jgi:hypothetical protein